MGRQIVQQPDKKFAIWSSIIGNFLYVDLTEEEVVEFFVSEAADKMKEEVKSEIEQIKNGEKPYYQFTISYEEALERVRLASGKVAYTIGRTSAYDKNLKNPELVKKVGQRVDYDGGWVWPSFEAADEFRLTRLSEVAPDWNLDDFSVYELELPNGWGQDVSPELNNDGVRCLINDAIIVEKVNHG